MSKNRPHIPKKLRYEVVGRYGLSCQYCQYPIGNAQVAMDHVVPVVKGGPTKIGNLVVSCPRCNGKKWHRDSGHDYLSDAEYPLFNPITQNWGDHFRITFGIHPVGTSPIGRVTQNILWSEPSFQAFEMPRWDLASNIIHKGLREQLYVMYWNVEYGIHSKFEELKKSFYALIDDIGSPSCRKWAQVLCIYLDVKISIKRSSYLDLCGCIHKALWLTVAVSWQSSIYRDAINHLAIAYKQLACMSYLRYGTVHPYAERALHYSSKFNANYLSVGIVNEVNNERSFVLGRSLRQFAQAAQFDEEFTKNIELPIKQIKRMVILSPPGYNQDLLRFSADFSMETQEKDLEFMEFVADELDQEVAKYGFTLRSAGVNAAYLSRRSTLLLIMAKHDCCERVRRDLDFFYKQELYNEIRETIRCFIAISKRGNLNMLDIKDCILQFAQKAIETCKGSLPRDRFLYEIETIKMDAQRICVLRQ